VDDTLAGGLVERAARGQGRGLCGILVAGGDGVSTFLIAVLTSERTA